MKMFVSEKIQIGENTSEKKGPIKTEIQLFNGRMLFGKVSSRS